VLEAMASGLPVVASDWAGHREMIMHGQSGFLVPTLWNEPAATVASFLVPAFDEISSAYLARRTVVDVNSLIGHLSVLVERADLRKELGAAGRKRAVECFDWTVIIGKFRAVWDEQLKKSVQSLANDAQPPLGLDAMFRRYASMDLAFDSEIVSSDKGAALVGLPAGNAFAIDGAGEAGDFRNEILRVLGYCSWPRTIRSIVDSGNEFSYEAAVWLLKKGFCGLKRP
jgi:hypothetical protein